MVREDEEQRAEHYRQMRAELEAERRERLALLGGDATQRAQLEENWRPVILANAERSNE